MSIKPVSDSFLSVIYLYEIYIDQCDILHITNQIEIPIHAFFDSSWFSVILAPLKLPVCGLILPQSTLG